MDVNDIDNRFQYHPPKDERTKEAYERVREICRSAAQEINELVPEGREKSLAVTKLEETMMWANAGLARSGDAS